MDAPDRRRDARLRRLVDELRDDVGREFDLADAAGRLVVEEIDQARRPPVHERRVVSSGVLGSSRG